MNNEQLTSAARTVVELNQYLEDLKSQALEIYNSDKVAARGYITPSKETQLRHLQLSYWKTRGALFELVYELWRDAERFDRATPEQFLIGLAAAALLVDAARFLRESFHQNPIVRHKLDEPDPVYGIPARMYDSVQRSLTDPYHAWHLWQATRYYDRHHAQLVTAAAAADLSPLVTIIDHLRDRLRPSVWTYIRTRAQVRARQAARRVGRDMFGRALYGVQEAMGRGLAEIHVRPGHAPSLPKEIRAQVVDLLRPGDVLIVRKDFAITNYFLPGYWPHAALFIGTVDRIATSEIARQSHVESRLPKLAAVTPDTAVLAPDPYNTWSDDAAHPCVLEAMKDGVHIRSVNSPFNSDSIVVVRPMLEPGQITAALGQALMHEGKPYDFDFDFCASHRLVCTEVVYRAYEGIAGVQFDLHRHAGRFALAAGDILRMGLARRHFEIAAVYSRPHAPGLQQGPDAHEIVNRVEGGTMGGTP